MKYYIVNNKLFDDENLANVWAETMKTFDELNGGVGRRPEVHEVDVTTVEDIRTYIETAYEHARTEDKHVFEKVLETA